MCVRESNRITLNQPITSLSETIDKTHRETFDLSYIIREANI